MRTLFFSNPSREEYECLFVNGSRRRKRRSKNNSESRADFGGGTDASASVTATTSKKDSIPPDEREKIIRVERVTKPDEASIYVIDNFLSEKELEYFDEKIRSIPFERSFKTGKKRKKRKRKTLVDDSHRTSTFYSFRKLHDAKISALERRIANILGCWVHQIEALQLVRYVPGQFFGIHHDLGNLLEDDNVELPPKDWASKRRLVTMFCYLNTLQEDEGGCTYFPKCSDLRVQPKRGRAVLWCNITQDGKPDATTIHAGEVVTMTAGKAVATKYGLNIWVCEE
eukprot:jgi/Psemu1/243091/estExt_Genewise1.C_3330026